ncbi:MAG: transcription antitermination factor NusB [Pyrinomonadaceae bacterium]
MSSDKSAKNTGTRHKARECALHMLFAYDLVRPARYDLADYWGELGLEELHKGITQLVWSFVDESARLERVVSDLRNFFKQLEPLEKSTSRTDKLKSISVQIERLVKDYRAFIASVERGRDIDSQEVYRGLQAIRNTFAALALDFESAVSLKLIRPQRSDLADFSDLQKQAAQSLDKMADSILPEVERTVDLTANSRAFSDRIVTGTLRELATIDDRIRTRAEHWRIERMAVVDRNVLRLAVYEFLYEDTPGTVVINEALEIARRFSTFEATQFINGILDAIRHDLEKSSGGAETGRTQQASSS